MNEKQARIMGAVGGILVAAFAILGLSMGVFDSGTVKKLIRGALLIAVIAGSVGTYFEIKRAKSPQRRRFAIQSAILFWVIIVPYFILVLVDFPYMGVMSFFLMIFFYKWGVWMKKRRQEIEASEKKEIINHEPHEPHEQESRK